MNQLLDTKVGQGRANKLRLNIDKIEKQWMSGSWIQELGLVCLPVLDALGAGTQSESIV